MIEVPIFFVLVVVVCLFNFDVEISVFVVILVEPTVLFCSFDVPNVVFAVLINVVFDNAGDVILNIYTK